LEIGAGMGENTECLLEGGSTVCATDISSNSVRLMEKRFGTYKEFSARVADMEALPFPDDSSEVKYFGSLIWISALLKWILSGETISILLNHADNLVNVKKSAFKFTIKVVKS